MTQDHNHETELDGADYTGVGNEVTNVLVVARDAAHEVRHQARMYAEAAITSARQDADDILGNAKDEAAHLVEAAREESTEILLDARRKVLSIVEEAQRRVADAQRQVEAAEQRQAELQAVAGATQRRIAGVISSFEEQLKTLAVAAEAAQARPSQDFTPSGSIEELLAASATALLDAQPNGDEHTADAE